MPVHSPGLGVLRPTVVDELPSVLRGQSLRIEKSARAPPFLDTTFRTHDHIPLLAHLMEEPVRKFDLVHQQHNWLLRAGSIVGPTRRRAVESAALRSLWGKKRRGCARGRPHRAAQQLRHRAVELRHVRSRERGERLRSKRERKPGCGISAAQIRTFGGGSRRIILAGTHRAHLHKLLSKKLQIRARAT